VKNKVFTIALFVVFIVLSFFFLMLIISTVTQLGTTTSIRGVNKTEVFFAIKLTLFTATVSSILALIISIPVSYILARYQFPLKDLVDTLLYLPIVLSPIALGAMLLIFFNTLPGRLIENNVLTFVFEVPGIILAQFIVIIGLAISLVKSTFEYVNPVYENIARTLGANRFQVFTRVLLPLSKNGIISAFLLVWARAVGEFGATVTLAGATTMKTETLPIGIFLSFASADVHSACIFILISVVISLAVLFLIKKMYAYSRKSLL
jgi:molybdate transport system permease protein